MENVEAFLVLLQVQIAFHTSKYCLRWLSSILPRASYRAWPIWLPVLLGIVETLGLLAGLIALIAFIAVAFTRYKQGLHDMMAKCLVVKREARFEDVEDVFS